MRRGNWAEALDAEQKECTCLSVLNNTATPLFTGLRFEFSFLVLLSSLISLLSFTIGIEWEAQVD